MACPLEAYRLPTDRTSGRPGSSSLGATWACPVTPLGTVCSRSLGNVALEAPGDRAADGHDRGGAVERADGALAHRPRPCEVHVHVGAVDGDDVGDAEVRGQQPRRGAVGERLVGVDEVGSALSQGGQDGPQTAVEQVALPMGQEPPGRHHDPGVLHGDAVDHRCRRRGAARPQAVVDPQQSRRVDGRRDDEGLDAELTQREDLIVDEERAGPGRRGIQV